MTEARESPGASGPDGRLDELAARVIAAATRRGMTIAVAESLTGGALTDRLTSPPGASAVVLGGVVVYATELKHTLVGVDAELLERHGPVDPEVARQLASGVRERLAVAGRPADIGVATTGVAGPDPQGGQSPGTVFLGFATAQRSLSEALHLAGSRRDIRAETVSRALEALSRLVESDARSRYPDGE